MNMIAIIIQIISLQPFPQPLLKPNIKLPPFLQQLNYLQPQSPMPATLSLPNKPFPQPQQQIITMIIKNQSNVLSLSNPHPLNNDM